MQIAYLEDSSRKYPGESREERQGREGPHKECVIKQVPPWPSEDLRNNVGNAPQGYPTQGQDGWGTNSPSVVGCRLLPGP